MNLLEIKTAVAAYFCMPSGTQVQVTDLTVNGSDLFLVAANQAKQSAMQLHDFGFQRILLNLVLDTGGNGLVSSAVDTSGNSYEVKTLLDIGIISPLGVFTPVEWTTTEESQERQREENRYGRGWYRYPTDAQCNHCYPWGEFRVILRGDSVSLYPPVLHPLAQTITLGLDAYVFDADWTADDYGSTDPNTHVVVNPTTDDWTTKGAQYIMWQSICDLNNYFKSFVTRQEGNLPPPQERASTALQAFIDWDVFKYEQGRRHGR